MLNCEDSNIRFSHASVREMFDETGPQATYLSWEIATNKECDKPNVHCSLYVQRLRTSSRFWKRQDTSNEDVQGWVSLAFRIPTDISWTAVVNILHTTHH